MNHTIIKKALNEALSQRYYDELMGCDDEEHIFGVGFTADMKRLIRKTDDKLLYYAKYAAIAACACIAVGCAVLLPNLLNSGIDTEPAVTTPAIETGTTPTETTLPIIITTTETTTTATTTTPETTVSDTTPVTETTEEFDDTNPGQGFETTATTETPVTETEKIPETENDENPGSAGGDEEIGDEDTDADRDSPDTGGDIIIDDEGDDALPLPEEGDDVVVEEDDDADIEADTEEEVEIEDDSDSDDDVVVEEDDDVVEDDEEYVEPVPLLSATLGEAVGQLLLGDPSADLNGKIYTERLAYMAPLGDDGDSASTFTWTSNYSDLNFITQYVIDNADAPRTDTRGVYEKDYLFIRMSDVPTNPPVFYDYSICNKYEEFYGPQVDVEDEEDVMEDEVINDGYSQISLSIYQNDIIEVWQSGYVTAYFEAETSELFTLLENKGFSKAPKTVGDVITDLNLTADNIRNAYGRVSGIYDLSLGNAHIDTAADKSALISFLNKIKSKKLTAVKENLRYSEMARIQLTVNGDPSLIEIMMLDDKLYFTDDSSTMKWYSTPVTQSEMEEFITLICKSENLKTPVFYKTLDEYVKNAMGSIDATDAEYSETKSGVTTYYIIKDKAVVNELTALVNKWAKKAEYEPFYKYPSTRTEWLHINTGGYTMTIRSDNSANIWVNNFMAPAGFFDEIKAFIVKNGVISVEEEYTVEDDVAYEDDLEEEDIPIEDEVDY